MKKKTDFYKKVVKPLNTPKKKIINSPQEIEEAKETLDKFAVLERMVKSITTF